MHFSTAPSLFLGLGARILLDTFTRSHEPSIPDFLLFGVWQGVGLHYAFMNSDFALVIGAGIAAKLFIDYTLVQDMTKCACTLLGTALGIVSTDVLSQYLDKSYGRRTKPHNNPSRGGHTSHRQRLVQFRRSVEGEGSESPRHRAFRHTHSDITSVDSNSDLIGPNPSMTPLDREVAALRARASLADSERRRFKEEKKWAISQGNPARASQMSWQVKRYTALMQNFHKQADARIIEATNQRARQTAIDEQTRPTTNERHPQSQSHDTRINHTAANPDNKSPRRKRSGTLKSAIRVQAR